MLDSRALYWYIMVIHLHLNYSRSDHAVHLFLAVERIIRSRRFSLQGLGKPQRCCRQLQNCLGVARLYSVPFWHFLLRLNSLQLGSLSCCFPFPFADFVPLESTALAVGARGDLLMRPAKEEPLACYSMYCLEGYSDFELLLKTGFSNSDSCSKCLSLELRWPTVPAHELKAH